MEAHAQMHRAFLPWDQPRRDQFTRRFQRLFGMVWSGKARWPDGHDAVAVKRHQETVIVGNHPCRGIQKGRHAGLHICGTGVVRELGGVADVHEQQ
jgi:hypothetical protein